MAMAMASAPLLLLRRVALLEAPLARHGVAVPSASAATRAACAEAADTLSPRPRADCASAAGARRR